MKILILSDAQSVHTKRWTIALKERGLEIILYTIKPPLDHFYTENGIKTYSFDLFSYKKKGGPIASIMQHLTAKEDLQKILAVEKPDILHAHYLTSYAFIAARSGFHPLMVSMWGSDIYEFPHRSIFKRLSVKYILRNADLILSTSWIMAREARHYTHKKILITPFGVDTGKFFNKKTAIKKNTFIVGTVKTLSSKYGIDTLIRAFGILAERNPSVDCRLKIVGSGPDKEKLEALASSLGLDAKVNFVGAVDNESVPKYLNSFSVAAFLSNAESFGVAAIEAMACECPVVVSDADGFREVVDDGVSGFIVPKSDPESAAAALQKFIDNPSLRGTMGVAGRDRVMKLYRWSDNVDNMVSIYEDLLKERNGQS